MKTAPEEIDPKKYPELACLQSIIHDEDRPPEGRLSPVLLPLKICELSSLEPPFQVYIFLFHSRASKEPERWGKCIFQGEELPKSHTVLYCRFEEELWGPGNQYCSPHQPGCSTFPPGLAFLLFIFTYLYISSWISSAFTVLCCTGNMRSALNDAAAAKKVKPDHLKALIRGM